MELTDFNLKLTVGRGKNKKEYVADFPTLGMIEDYQKGMAKIEPTKALDEMKKFLNDCSLPDEAVREMSMPQINQVLTALVGGGEQGK